MAKKKLSDVQKLKREVEVLKAQLKSDSLKVEKIIVPSQDSGKTTPAMKVTGSKDTSTRFSLPVKEIKHDLVRIAVFSVVSIGLVITLGVLRVDVSNLLNLVPKF